MTIKKKKKVIKHCTKRVKKRKMEASVQLSVLQRLWKKRRPLQLALRLLAAQTLPIPKVINSPMMMMMMMVQLGMCQVSIPLKISSLTHVSFVKSMTARMLHVHYGNQIKVNNLLYVFFVKTKSLVDGQMVGNQKMLTIRKLSKCIATNLSIVMQTNRRMFLSMTMKLLLILLAPPVNLVLLPHLLIVALKRKIIRQRRIL
mmetsp:Transcript_922/g.1277  ORF Transcript_922/g.1277 Transcript_922/m.1277 type:complete len:201 (+) Transcript_922:1310-1912(+)